MAKDLKQEAERYRSQERKIPTSESLSMKKLTYIFLALLFVTAGVIYLSGGFEARTNPIVAASTPVPLNIEPPSQELLGEAVAETETAATPAAPPASAAKPALPPVVEPEPPRPKKFPPPPDPATASKPPPRRAPAERAEGSPGSNRRKSAPVLTREPVNAKAPKKKEPVAAPEPEPPALSAMEKAQQERAREIVLEKATALARLLTGGGPLLYRDWAAEPMGPEDYRVTFTFVEESGKTIQYIWKVNVPGSSITPLSYHARKLR